MPSVEDIPEGGRKQVFVDWGEVFVFELVKRGLPHVAACNMEPRFVDGKIVGLPCSGISDENVPRSSMVNKTARQLFDEKRKWHTQQQRSITSTENPS